MLGTSLSVCDNKHVTVRLTTCQRYFKSHPAVRHKDVRRSHDNKPTTPSILEVTLTFSSAPSAAHYSLFLHAIRFSFFFFFAIIHEALCLEEIIIMICCWPTLILYLICHLHSGAIDEKCIDHNCVIFYYSYKKLMEDQVLYLKAPCCLRGSLDGFRFREQGAWREGSSFD